MLTIKFFVLVIYFSDVITYQTKYCKICPNHTLCKYKLPGPSQQCVGYDRDALLTEDDTKAILDKINERRNFIALGHLKSLPAAANMKKLVWSEELAVFAQRWVDQCDQSLTPEWKDQCRNLEHLEVGQNIATITGISTSPRYNIKSFIEMWFMQSMDYNGSVIYYNQSQDEKTNYFTQLIWANTHKVGCGKAKFFIKNVKPILIERLVCNFAPKANIEGQPVYTIGYAATQCGDGMNQDRNYLGLCSYETELTGDVKDAVKRSYHSINEDFWRSQILNDSRYYGYNLRKREKGHSKVHHGHDHRNEFDSYPEIFHEDMRKYDYTTAAPYLSKEQNYRKNNINRQCTRKSELKVNSLDSSECMPCHQTIKKCTRNTKNSCRQKNDCQITTHRYEGYNFHPTLNSNPREFCACNTPSNYLLSTNQCVQNSNCGCIRINYSTRSCPNMLRTLRDADINFEMRDFQYYDTVPYTQERINKKAVSKISLGTRDGPSNDNNRSPYKKGLRILDKRKEISRNHSGRKKRTVEEDKKYKPFWQMDEYINKNQPQLKSIKYTTLSKRKSLKYKQTRKNSRPVETESITVAYKKVYKDGKRITEKYLSFDELMYLRKHNTENLSGRRHNEDKEILRESDSAASPQVTKIPSQSNAATETPEYTFNTPYIRMKYCTRKLTCTWTAASLTDSAGSIIPGRPGGVGGSRTPPGYVEGCTRTSTCTRDYMNRNKMATITIDTTSPEPISDEEDYCERRSLNRRSNSNKILNFFNQSQLSIPKENISKLNDSLSNTSHNCICNDENFRTKRANYDYRQINFPKYENEEEREYENHIAHQNNLLSYGDLYYYVVRKIIKMWGIANNSYARGECICNGVNKILCFYLFILFIIFLQYTLL